MSDKNFDIYFDFGSSKIRAGAFNKNDSSNNFVIERSVVSDFSSIESKFSNSENMIEEIILELEKKTKEYLDNINLMIDTSKIFSVGLSIKKNFDNLKLSQEDVQFLIQDAKQQILRNYSDQKIIHIIIKNYKINNDDYDFLSTEIDCNSLSVDIIFICLPKDILRYLKRAFSKFNISINQIYLSSYAKSLNYKDNFDLNEDLVFIDMGYNKTSIFFYKKSNISFFNVLPIGGNHITKDISKILNLDLDNAEKIKLYFGKDDKFFNDKNFSIDLVQRIIFSRIEEILELCTKSIIFNENLKGTNELRMVLMGEGSKILDNKFKDKILFSQKIDLLDEDALTICESALKLNKGKNNQEVVLVPKKTKKSGFFEKLFHSFK